MTALERLRSAATRIAVAEEAGEHDVAAIHWDFLDEQLERLSFDDARNVIKQLLIAGTSSSVTLASGPAGAFR